MCIRDSTSAASIPILLSECVENHRIKMDGSQKILLTGFGGGLTWGTLLVTIQLNMWKHILKIYLLFLRRPIMAVFEKVQEIIVEELGKEPSERCV